MLGLEDQISFCLPEVDSQDNLLNIMMIEEYLDLDNAGELA